eukprot:1651037-Pyramimonas_sp.AAC.1
MTGTTTVDGAATTATFGLARGGKRHGLQDFGERPDIQSCGARQQHMAHRHAPRAHRRSDPGAARRNSLAKAQLDAHFSDPHLGGPWQDENP